MPEAWLEVTIQITSLSPARRAELAALPEKEADEALLEVVAAWYGVSEVTIRVTGSGEIRRGAGSLTIKMRVPSDNDIAAATREYNKGLEYAMRGDLDAARKCFEAAACKNPIDPTTLTALGQAALELGDFETAETQLLRSLALCQTDPIALQLLGNIYYFQGDLDVAISLYNQSIESAPTAYALTNLGAALAKRGDFAAARMALLEALKINPDYSKARYALELLANQP